MINVILALSLVVLVISVFMKSPTSLLIKMWALTIFFSMLAVGDFVENGQLQLKVIFGLLWVYLFFVYLLGVKHVMGLGFLESVTHEKFKVFVKEKGKGYFSSTLLILAPVLFWSAIILTAVIISGSFK